MIVPVSEAILDEVILLRVSVFEEYGKIKTKEEKDELIKINTRYFRDLFKKGKLLGYVEKFEDRIISISLGAILDFPPVSNADDGIRGYIFNVYTETEYRNNHKAEKLLGLLLQSFKEKNVRKILLDANENSLTLYERIGFEIQDKSMVLNLC